MQVNPKGKVKGKCKILRGGVLLQECLFSACRSFSLPMLPSKNRGF